MNKTDRAGDTGGLVGGKGGGMAPSPLFYVAKRKKGDKGKKERVSRQKLSKGCHQVQNIVLAILERLEFENFLVSQPWWPTVLSNVPSETNTM